MAVPSASLPGYAPVVERPDVAILDGSGPGVIVITLLTAIILVGSFYSTQLLQLFEIAWRIVLSVR